jgi:hypothetical protein
VVAVKDLEERCLSAISYENGVQFKVAYLCAGGPLHTPESDIVPCALEIIEILQQILYPQARTLSDRGQLCGLKMCVSEAREVLVLFCKVGELFNDSSQFWQ